MNNLMYQYLDNLSQKYGQRTAFCYTKQGELKTVSYRQFVQDIFCTAGALRDYQGAHIAILARNSYAYIVNLLGIMAADAAAVLLNMEENWNVLHQQIELADVRLILHDGEYLSENAELGSCGITLKPVEIPSDCAPLKSGTAEKMDALAMMMFTSGTTGTGKAVQYTYRTLLAIAKGYSEYFASFLKRKNENHVDFFLCLPMYHAYAIVMSSACIANGYSISLCSESKNMMRDMRLLPCNCTAMVPVGLKMVYKRLKQGKRDQLGEIKDIVCAAAPGDPDVFRMFIDNGISITQLYGLTENTVGTLNVSDDIAKIKSVGAKFGDTELAIVDGEILLKGSSLTIGYYKNPEATAEAIQDGWLHTGDLGYLDEDGYLYINGRKKNLIILSTGENVNPEELEGLLMRNPDIKEVVVLEKDAKICAQIYCAPEKQEEIQRYVDEVNKQVAIYKWIGLVEFREEPFPRTASGKIKRV